MNDIIADVRDLLSKWLQGEMDERQVHERAEALMEQLGWPEYVKEDYRAKAVEVLSQLEIMNHQLITREDIPAMLSFLSSPSNRAQEAWNEWNTYWESLDLKTRKHQLKGNPFYIV